MKQALFLCILLIATLSVAQSANSTTIKCRKVDDIFQIENGGNLYVYNLDKASAAGELSATPPAHDPICLPTDTTRILWYTQDSHKKVKVKSIAPAAGADPKCNKDHGKPFRDDPRNTAASHFVESDIVPADFDGCSYEIHVQYAGANGDPHIYVGGGRAELEAALEHAQEELAFWQKEVPVLQQKLNAATTTQTKTPGN